MVQRVYKCTATITKSVPPPQQSQQQPQQQQQQKPPAPQQAIALYSLKFKKITDYNTRNAFGLNTFNNDKFFSEYPGEVYLNYTNIYARNSKIGIILTNLLDTYLNKQNRQNAEALINYMNNTVIPDLEQSFNFRSSSSGGKRKYTKRKQKTTATKSPSKPTFTKMH